MNKPDILFVDTNVGLDHALKAAQTLGKKVYYYIPWQTGYPKPEDSISGKGFDLLEKIYDMGGVLDEVDTVIFLDLGFAPTIKMLKEQGYNVYGCPPQVERLEVDRVWGKKKLEELGLKVTKDITITGVSNVIKFFEKHEGEKHYIKVNLYRGAMETKYADSADSARVVLGTGNFGIYAEEMIFTLEPEAEGIEIGVDTWFCNDKFVQPHFSTIEIKGQGNLGHFVTDSIFIEHFMKPIEPFLRDENFSGSISAEGFWNGKDFKIMDMCCRPAYPCSASWAFGIKDYGKFLVSLCADEVDTFEVIKPFQSCLGVYAGDPKDWRKIEVDESKLKKDEIGVSFRKVVKADDGLYFVPGDCVLACGLGGGDTWEEAMKNSAIAADAIHASDAGTSGLIEEEYIKKIKELLQLGHKF